MKKIILILLLLNLTNAFSQEKSENWVIKNLAINNVGSNLGPSFYGSNKIVFSSSTGGRLHLFSGTVEGGDVKDQDQFLETKTHDSSATFTSDMNTMYFTRSLYGKENTVRYDKDRRETVAIFRATRSANGKWGNIVSVPFNNEKYDVGHPTISNDNSKLYFSSNMPGSVGKSDLYVVDILGNNTYSEPKNLGKKINTKGNELYPYMAKDGVLYFTSNGYGGLGGLDIYGVNVNDPSAKPTHLNSPINSKYDDLSYIYNPATKQGFFASNRPGGKGSDDIYSFKIKEEKKEEVVEKIAQEAGCNQNLMGTVYLNASQKVIPNAVIKLLDENENVVETYETDESARFVFKVKCSRTYKLVGSKETYKTSERLMVTNAQDGIMARKNIFLTTSKTVEGKTRREHIGQVDFEYNKTNLLRRYRYQLDKAIVKMKKNPKLTIHFESHTDSRAPTDFNMELSLARIEVLKEYIGFKGIFRKRFSGKAFGETKPLNKCVKGVKCTEEQYLLNRRTTFVLRENK